LKSVFKSAASTTVSYHDLSYSSPKSILSLTVLFYNQWFCETYAVDPLRIIFLSKLSILYPFSSKIMDSLELSEDPSSSFRIAFKNADFPDPSKRNKK